MEKRLPDFNHLVRLAEQGLSYEVIGDRFGVTATAVNMALTAGGYYRRAGSRKAIEEYIPWTVKRVVGAESHHRSYLAQSLMGFLHVSMGDEKATKAHFDRHRRLAARLRREGLVLDYDTEAGFVLVAREPRDGNLVLRWPEDVDGPSDEVRAVLELPEE
ncbi:hypothetical protein ACN20G_23515 [Streptomyces sp. BI20]|uniref:hypothetical protein n=1 Tax=Streptomyces sp. BI20 TaxID=3403460 RepID=UPI003C74EAB3